MGKATQVFLGTLRLSLFHWGISLMLTKVSWRAIGLFLFDLVGGETFEELKTFNRFQKKNDSSLITGKPP